MHPIRKINLFRAFCAGLKYGALPGRAPFKSYPDQERTTSFECGVRCGKAILECAAVCYGFVQQSRRITTATRTPLLVSAEVVYGSPDAGIPEDTDDDDMECDDPCCGCHDGYSDGEDEDEEDAGNESEKA